MITKKFVKNAIKPLGFTMIEKSWYVCNDDDVKGCILFNAYDDYGDCYSFFISEKKRIACWQALSTICIHEKHYVDWLFPR